MNKTEQLSRQLKRRPTKPCGDLGEARAAQYLEEAGYSIVARNYRNGRRGEIDIIAMSPDSALVFVEVKTRRFPLRERQTVALTHSLAGFESLVAGKIRKILCTAAAFRAQSTLRYRYYRFDAIVVTCFFDEFGNDEFDVVHVENAFGQ